MVTDSLGWYQAVYRNHVVGNHACPDAGSFWHLVKDHSGIDACAKP